MVLNKAGVSLGAFARSSPSTGPYSRSADSVGGGAKRNGLQRDSREEGGGGSSWRGDDDRGSCPPEQGGHLHADQEQEVPAMGRRVIFTEFATHFSLLECSKHSGGVEEEGEERASNSPFSGGGKASNADGESQSGEISEGDDQEDASFEDDQMQVQQDEMEGEEAEDGGSSSTGRVTSAGDKRPAGSLQLQGAGASKRAKKVVMTERRRTNACIRGIAFISRGFEQCKDNSKWSQFGGDVMLLMAGVAKRCVKGRIQQAAVKTFRVISKFFRQKCARVGGLQKDLQVGGVGRGGDEGTDWALGAAEGLLGLSWMGCDVHKSKDLNSTLNSVQKALRTIDVHDIFGFDPARGELPMTRKSCCNNCTFQNGASSRRCRLCGWVLRSRPQYEDLTDAIVWGFVFGQLGLSVLPQVRREKDVVETIDPIKLTREVLKVYAKVYPYLPISRLGLDLYKQQCYCITHLLLALSSYGQLKLPKSLFASELKFIREEMSQVMKLKDPELVGEFVDCLLIFGCPKLDPTVVEGRNFLLQREHSFHSVGRWSDSECYFYTHYHSSYCAVAGLMDHRFTGEGPLHSEEWQVVAEQSSYWADRWEAVREFKNLKALPEWSKWKYDTLPDVIPGENRGKFAGGQQGFKDLSLLGDPLGMESGAIADSCITSSSTWKSPDWPESDSAALKARLNVKSSGAGCWLSQHLGWDEWLQIDLGRACRVTGVATQGRGETREGAYEQWVTCFEIEHSDSADVWKKVTCTFRANRDTKTAVGHILAPPLVCRYIRIKPTAWNHHIALRAELYGSPL